MSSSGRHIPTKIQNRVRARANSLCEYCHANEAWQYVQFTIDHIVGLSLGGTNDIENLALACFHCNRHKSNRLTAIDPKTGNLCDLFNPRIDVWAKHFAWSEDGAKVIGLSPKGRAAIDLLRLNRPRIVDIRLADVAIGRHPPKTDLS